MHICGPVPTESESAVVLRRTIWEGPLRIQLLGPVLILDTQKALLSQRIVSLNVRGNTDPMKAFGVICSQLVYSGTPTNERRCGSLLKCSKPLACLAKSCIPLAALMQKGNSILKWPMFHTRFFLAFSQVGEASGSPCLEGARE